MRPSTSFFTWVFCPIAAITQSHSTRNSLPLTGFGLRRPLASGSPSSMRRHSSALTRAPFLDHPHGCHEEIHLHSLVRRLHDFNLVGGHLVSGTPIEKPDLSGVEAQRGARAVDGGVAAAHD